MSKIYVMITNGDVESVWACSDKDMSLLECQTAVLEYMWYMHKYKIHGGEIIQASDLDHGVRLIEIDYGFDRDVAEVRLPVQSWINEAIVEAMEERQKENTAKQDPEWEEYMRLREKFKGVH